jgi:ABC-2 type transport system permease protein
MMSKLIQIQTASEWRDTVGPLSPLGQASFDPIDLDRHQPDEHWLLLSDDREAIGHLTKGLALLGTLEAMLVSPTPTSVVIFSSTAWDFTWGGIRLLVYLLSAVFIFGVKLNVASPAALVLGVVLTLLSSAGVGMLSASFILYFKRGDPINFLLTTGTMFFGNVVFPSRLLPGPVQWVSEWLPMSWSLQVVRGALLRGASFGDVAGPIGRLAVLTAILVPLGLWGARIAIRKAKREGSLVQY